MKTDTTELERVKAERDELEGNLKVAANAYDTMKAERDGLERALKFIEVHLALVDKEVCLGAYGTLALQTARAALAGLEAKRG